MHNIYPYHAKFTSEIPHKFIEQYSKEGDLILDPFCGCGTTLLEGLKLNRNVIGVDLSPIGILCSKVKTSKYSLDEIKTIATNILSTNPENCKIPEFPNQTEWYNENVIKNMGMIYYNIFKISDEKYKNLFLLIFLSIVNKCARTRKTWNLGYMADNVMPNLDRNVDVNKLYSEQIKKMFKRKDYIPLDNHNSVRIIENDIKDVTDISGVKLVVTSPPYPFAVDFIRYHRLALYWLEKPVEELSAKEVGARNKRSRKSALDEFYYQMKVIYEHVMGMVDINGFWCMTIGNTQRNKTDINFVSWTIDLFQQNGWELVKHKIRNLEKQTMAQKRIPQESMLVFQKKKE